MIEILDDITLLDFQDRTGKFRSTGGCSLKGKIEFDERIAKIREILDNSSPDKKVSDLYRENELFAYCCDRALELNDIDPSWINDSLLESLLFNNKGKVGALIALNTMNGVTGGKAGGAPATYTDLLAALASYIDPAKAMELAETRNWKEVLGMLEKLNEKLVTEKSEPLEEKPRNNIHKEKKRSKRPSQLQLERSRLILAKAVKES